MATLIYAARALIAYRRSKSEATDKSIVSPSSNAGSSIEDEDERIALFLATIPIRPVPFRSHEAIATPTSNAESPIEDGDEHSTHFPHHHAPSTISQSNATSNETTAPANSPPHSHSISLDIRTVENNEAITLDSPAVVCIQKREIALSNYEAWAQMARKGEKFASTPAIKIRASALNGQDDLILCHYHTVLLARIPVSRMSRDESQRWTMNLVNALETVLCQDPIRRRTGGCKSCFIVCNKNAQSHWNTQGKETGIRSYTDGSARCGICWTDILHTEAVVGVGATEIAGQFAREVGA